MWRFNYDRFSFIVVSFFDMRNSGYAYCLVSREHRFLCKDTKRNAEKIILARHADRIVDLHRFVFFVCSGDPCRHNDVDIVNVR